MNLIFFFVARWKFREFNELPHEFEERLNSAHEPSAKYLAQFPGIYFMFDHCVSHSNSMGF